MERLHSTTKVAVVGSGLAGLTTAYLLQRDPQRRYDVRVFEKKSELSLNSESILVPCEDSKPVWADVPMRALAGGFYRNLMLMYDYLGVPYRSQPFVFSFAKRNPADRKESTGSLHMIHTSNFHHLPPKPLDCGLAQWLLEAGYVLLCYLWFTICCFFIAPHEASAKAECESFEHYLQRIAMPQHYVRNYLLPLISSVCTCSHQELLDFPARDILEYKRRTHGEQHYVVDGGVQAAQEKLSKGLDVRLGVSLTAVARTPEGVDLTWVDANGKEEHETFDAVVLAVSPDISATLFEPLRPLLSEIPTRMVESVAHTDRSSLQDVELALLDKMGASREGKPHPRSSHIIHFLSDGCNTESIHETPTSIIVTTNNLRPIDSSSIVRVSSFTRVLRSPRSRQILNRIFCEDDDVLSEKNPSGWRNGDGGVYLAGGWCWDGMVLLEGCIVSAMRVASSLGVEIPWAIEECSRVS